MTFLHFPAPSCRFFRFYVQFTSVYKYSQENNGLFWEKTTVVFEKTLDVFEKTLDVFGKTLDVFFKTTVCAKNCLGDAVKTAFK